MNRDWDMIGDGGSDQIEDSILIGRPIVWKPIIGGGPDE